MTTHPAGATAHDVRRRWLAWRQRIPFDGELVVLVPAVCELALRVALAPVAVALRGVGVLSWEIEVRDPHARRRASLVSRERVRGWGASQHRIDELRRELGAAPPPGARFPVVVTRDPVAMGDDMVDGSRTYELDDRRADPTISALVEVLRRSAPWVSVAGEPTTWVLRAHRGFTDRLGAPLAVLRLYDARGRVDVHPVADLSFRVARESRFHLEYLATQSVERTLELVAAGAPSLRDVQP